jgi:transposase-like protein
MLEQARKFSDEDKRAALALSVGNVQALSAEMSAYSRSLSCSIALESVYAQLSGGDQLGPAMVSAVEQVRTVYNNRVQQLGAAENKSTADIAADRQQRAEEMPEQRERGQIAIGCLRAMA